MQKVEVNVNDVPLEDVKKLDFDFVKGCLVLVFEDGSTQDVYLKERA